MCVLLTGGVRHTTSSSLEESSMMSGMPRGAAAFGASSLEESSMISGMPRGAAAGAARFGASSGRTWEQKLRSGQKRVCTCPARRARAAARTVRSDQVRLVAAIERVLEAIFMLSRKKKNEVIRGGLWRYGEDAGRGGGGGARPGTVAGAVPDEYRARAAYTVGMSAAGVPGWARRRALCPTRIRDTVIYATCTSFFFCGDVCNKRGAFEALQWCSCAGL